MKEVMPEPSWDAFKTQFLADAAIIGKEAAFAAVEQFTKARNVTEAACKGFYAAILKITAARPEQESHKQGSLQPFAQTGFYNLQEFQSSLQTQGRLNHPSIARWCCLLKGIVWPFQPAQLE